MLHASGMGGIWHIYMYLHMCLRQCTPMVNSHWFTTMYLGHNVITGSLMSEVCHPCLQILQLWLDSLFLAEKWHTAQPSTCFSASWTPLYYGHQSCAVKDLTLPLTGKPAIQMTNLLELLSPFITLSGRIYHRGNRPHTKAIPLVNVHLTFVHLFSLLMFYYQIAPQPSQNCCWTAWWIHELLIIGQIVGMVNETVSMV